MNMGAEVYGGTVQIIESYNVSVSRSMSLEAKIYREVEQIIEKEKGERRSCRKLNIEPKITVCFALEKRFHFHLDSIQ